MPFVDQGEPKAGPSINLAMILPYAAGVASAVLAIFLWGFLFSQMQNKWLAPILGGLIIGGAMRLAGKRAVPYGGLVAIGLTVASGLAGYVYRHIAVFVWVDENKQVIEVDTANAFKILFNQDMQSVLLMAFAAYIAFAIARSYPQEYAQQPPTVSE